MTAQYAAPKLTPQSRRERFILQTLNLTHDPFAYATAELELQTRSEDPPFFSYFVSPPTTPVYDDILERIREANPVFIFGAAGSGKTTLRYALEAMCRVSPDRTLAVTYTLGKTDAPGNDVTAVWRSLTQALATDLFVQVMEQFHNMPPPDAPLMERLARFWYAAIPHYGRNLRLHLERFQPNDVTGISPVWWTTWKRAVVRYTPLTSERLSFWQQLMTLEDKMPSEADVGREQFYEGLLLAKTLGFGQSYILVDVVDSSKRQRLHLEDHLTTLLHVLHTLNPPIPIYPKLFLPERWQNHVNNLATSLGWLTPQTLSAIMQWNHPEALHTIIEHRFRSAGSRIIGLNTIASQDIAGRLDEMIIQTADQSPRRLLQVINLLFDAHASRDPDEPLVTAVDWNRMCQMWNYGSPNPVPIVTNHQMAGNE
ncbi:MAG TPA: hypothetical protein PLD25_17695 [Chloroflexota bacterium]|nr:hypothetical protein [Chloroflexota bacterium]HUM71537.1 hypothetical protein [Chloroflexota bacterium]